MSQVDEQTEIVVCDNSDDDQSREIVARASAILTDPIRYFKTTQVLSMPDNWEAALDLATGEWIMYLTDDAFLLRGALGCIRDAMACGAEVIAWAHSAYFDSGWPELGRRNTLFIPDHISRTRTLDSRQAVRQLFSNPTKPHPLPKMMNSIAHRDVVTRATRRQGRFFLGPTPDYSAACSLLLNTTSYLYIGRPLMVDGVTRASIGATLSLPPNSSGQAFWTEFAQPLQEIAFLGIPTPWAAVAMSLEMVRRVYGNEAPILRLQVALSAISSNVARLEAEGVEVADYRRQLGKIALRLSQLDRWALAVSAFTQRVQWMVLHTLRRHSRWQGFERLRRKSAIAGNAAGFDDIEGAAEVAARRIELIRGDPARSMDQSHHDQARTGRRSPKR